MLAVALNGDFEWQGPEADIKTLDHKIAKKLAATIFQSGIPHLHRHRATAERSGPGPEEQDLVAGSFSLAEVERMICDGAITVAVLALLRLKGICRVTPRQF
jgi:hypothetical protein